MQGTAGIPEAGGELRDRLILANFPQLKPSPLPVLGTIPPAFHKLAASRGPGLFWQSFPNFKPSPFLCYVPPAFQKLAEAYFGKLSSTLTLPLPVLGTAGIPEAGGQPRDRLAWCRAR